ncbi:coproporphyrinogen oxidase [Ranunculus cassubicifolius]
MEASFLSTSTTLFPTPSPSKPSISISFLPKTLSPKSHISRKTLRSRSGSRSVVRSVAIEKERPETSRPDTFLREADDSPGKKSKSKSVRARFEKMIREAQDSICSAIEAADGGGKFKEDVVVFYGKEVFGRKLVLMFLLFMVLCLLMLIELLKEKGLLLRLDRFRFSQLGLAR